MMDFRIQVLLLAVIFDIIFGEMPSSFHPVVWMGKLINLFVGAAPAPLQENVWFVHGYFLCRDNGFSGKIP